MNPPLRIAMALCIVAACSCRPAHGLPDPVATEVFAGRDGALVMMDCGSGAISVVGSEIAAKRFAPCSTFKIWNTLIGLENGILTTATASFYKWDGKVRFLPDWNRDLNLREAFQASCVPAFQTLARTIGGKKMREYIDRIGYGNRDLSAGVDCFWLPSPGKKTILISPTEQAHLLRQLVMNKTPFSAKSIAELKTVMRVRETNHGTLYGKTGSGTSDGKQALGWYVGWVESRRKTVVFACLLQGDKVTGKEARALVERTVEKQGLL